MNTRSPAPAPASSLCLHASCVAIEGKCILFLGSSGCGKSDVALRLIDKGALLVADDQVILSCRDGVLYASAPVALKGLIEARHIGIFKVPHTQTDMPVHVCMEGVHMNDSGRLLERLPEPSVKEFLGVKITHWKVSFFDPSLVAKIHLLFKADATLVTG